MPHDIIIRNGTVIDGTGAASFRADVAIDGERISLIGDLADVSARQEIDAKGLCVTPGFVDLHTHLDAQIGWDPLMTPSSWHGVTTVLMGNCGVTFAPVSVSNREFLAEMMEKVEDIPREAIINGLPWDWTSHPEYLNSVEEMAPALNVVGLVGHCAVRYHVMGDRSLSGEAPTDVELAQIRDIAMESIDGGAVGYSTSRLLGHKVPDGRSVPGTHSSIDEYLSIADGMNDAGGGLFQAILDFQTKPEHEYRLLRAMAERAGDVLFSSDIAQADDATVERFDRFLTDTRATAGRITTVTMTRPSGMLMGLQQLAPVRGRAWKALMDLPTLSDRIDALSGAKLRAELIAEGKAKGLWFNPKLVYPLGNGDYADYSIQGGSSVAELASRKGVDPIEVIIDRLIESNGRELFNAWFLNRDAEGLGAILKLDGVCPGLGDAGAHAGQICDADAPTHYLSYWCRDQNLVSLPTAVHNLTAKPASVLGLIDRGTLAVGQYADINVFDIDRLESGYPTYVHDFPMSSGRFVSKSEGYAVTLVNGKLVAEDSVNTGVRPGKVIREFKRG